MRSTYRLRIVLKYKMREYFVMYTTFSLTSSFQFNALFIQRQEHLREEDDLHHIFLWYSDTQKVDFAEFKQLHLFRKGEGSRLYMKICAVFQLTYNRKERFFFVWKMKKQTTKYAHKTAEKWSH